MLNLENIDLQKEYQNDAEEISAVKSYIYRLVDELRFRLDNLPAENSSSAVRPDGDTPTPEPTPEPSPEPQPEPIGFDDIYPVGSIYMSVNNVSPATLFGGTWVQIKDTFLLSAGDNYTAGDTGGEAAHTLSTGEMPAHTHGSKSLSGTFYAYAWDNGGSSGIVSHTTPHKNMDMYGGDSVGHQYYTINASHEHTSVGNGTAHNNMPPYLAVYVWKRTA